MATLVLIAAPVRPADAAITTLNAWSNQLNQVAFPAGTVNASYAIPAGSRRLLVVAVASSAQNNQTQTVSATYGGQALTLAAGNAASGIRQHSYILYLNEAGIAAAASQVLSVTVTSGGTPVRNVVNAAVYAGVNQTAPIPSTQDFNSGGGSDLTIGPFAASLVIPTGGLGVEMINSHNDGGGATTTITAFATNWSSALGPTGGANAANNQAVTAYIAVNSTAGNTTSQHTASTNVRDSMSAIALSAAIGPSIAYAPAAGASAGTGGPVTFTGVTTFGSTGSGTITATPSGGNDSSTTTIGSFALSGADAANFTLTSAATLTFTAGVNTAQDITLTCVSGASARTANLQATETIGGGTTTSRFWVLNCPAALGPSLAYAPAAGASSGTGGPVGFTGLTTTGSTGSGSITVTPSGGAAVATTTLGAFTLSGTNAANFTVTSAATLTFTAGVNTPQTITMTCVSGASARTANLQATETISGGATTSRFWVLNCPAALGPSLTYAPTAGASAGTGGPVTFTGVTSAGSTGNGSISATPTGGGAGGGTTTLSAFTLSGTNAANFTVTSASTLTFNVGGAAQNITMTCTAGTAARTANLQATETIAGGATTSRFWVLNCPVAQQGVAQDGDVTLTGTFALNSYSTLSAAAASGSTSFTVASAAALALPACGAGCSNTNATSGNGLGTTLAYGDLLMLYQPQELGGTITTTNDTTFGAVTGTGYGSAGLYEFVYVSSVAGNVVTIDTSAGTNCTGLKKSYDAGAMIIRVPQLRNLTISSGGLLNPASAWDGSTGGVIALDVRPGAPYNDAHGTITINGTGRISASGFGFRPGVVDNLTSTANTNTAVMQQYRANDCAAGARKGESILGYAGDANTGTNCGSTVDNNETGAYVNAAPNANSGAFNRGALANGGGGGNAHNAGGGGGSNAGTGTWTGGGNPDRGAANAYDAAWNLDDNTSDPNDLPTVTATSTSPGGGRGGYTYNGANQNALTLKPGCNLLTAGTCAASWTGDSRLNRGGLGGRPLDLRPNADTVDRLYMGGGGGAGDGNNDASAAGGAGGGLIYLIARRIVTDAAATTSLILADGGAGADTITAGTLSGNDAPGGGGGGGTIVALVNQNISSNLRFSVVGGKGGNQLIDIGPEAEGPGGGGGGGVVAAYWMGGAPSFLLTGGNSGTTTATNGAANDSMTEFPLNGGTRGGSGVQLTAPARNSSPLLCLQDGSTFTTPVTNTYFKSNRNAGRIELEFSTSAEVGNLGFRVYGDIGGRRVVANELMASREVDSPLPQDYRTSIEDRGYERLYLADISVTGKEAVRGPFSIGESYGAKPVVAAYDWSVARSELASLAGQRGPGNSAEAYLRVSQRGMQSVTFEALQAAGVDLSGVPSSEVAVLGRTGPVIRRVRGAAVFGPGSVIEFFGDPTPDLYARTETYLVHRDVEAVRDMVTRTPLPLPAGPMAEQWTTVRYAPENRYGFSSPLPDPWFADRLLANGAPAGFDFPISAPAALNGSGTLKIRLWGAIDYPAGALPDHHVRVLFNGIAVTESRFDGLIAQDLEVAVANVVPGVNTVRIELPRDAGNAADLINLDAIELSYLRAPAFADGRLYGAGMRATGSASDRLFADGLGDADAGPAPATYQTLTLPGLGSSTRNFRIDAGTPTELAVAIGQSLETGILSESSEIWMSEPAGMFQPAVSAAPMPLDLAPGSSDYWVITHGLFAASVQPLLAARQQQGLSATLVDVDQIYRTYSAGNPDPKAILRFIQEVAAPRGARYLLLVGGDTYDAPGYLNSGSISFIPTIYERTNEIVAFAPADPAYGDLTGDGVPEIAVGRLPVRTVAEATEAVRKILAYDSQPATSKMMSVAGAADTGQSLNFRTAAQTFQSAIPSVWQQSSVYVDTLGMPAAQSAVIDGFNAGQSIVSYIGHSSPTQWGFEQVLASSQIPGLAANLNSPLVLQFGCWTTYFVLPTANSMSQALMLTPQRGASAVLGSTVLLDQPSHDLMASTMAPLLSPGRRIGDVVVNAKRRIASEQSGQLDGAEIFLGISLMGDPAQPIR